jgi:putative tricarboxylic transport membrane protein
VSGGKRLKKDEIMSGIVLFLFGGITVFLSLRMPLGTFRMAGTGLFPFCLGILLMILASLFLLKLYFQGKRPSGRKERSAEMTGSPKPLGLFFGAMVLATLFLNTFGYPLIAFLLMSALLRILGMKRWGLNILISLATTVGSYFLFVQWLQIPLPKGWIGL